MKIMALALSTGLGLFAAPTEASSRKMVIAHRGAHHYAPENSMQAIRNTFREGADAFEIDIKLTADGEPVVLHDATLDRTTDVTGCIGTLTWDVVRRTKLSNGAPLPHLDEVLEYLASLSLEWKLKHPYLANLELKSYGAVAGCPADDAQELGRVVTEHVRKYDLEKKVILSAFDPEALRGAHRASRTIRRAWITSQLTEAMIIQAYERGYFAINPEKSAVTTEKLEFARAHHLSIYPWTTYSQADYDHLMNDFAVSGVITDFLPPVVWSSSFFEMFWRGR